MPACRHRRPAGVDSLSGWGCVVALPLPPRDACCRVTAGVRVCVERSPAGVPAGAQGGRGHLLPVATRLDVWLGQAVARVATPGASQYRHFSSLDKAARQFGATDAQITTVAKSVKTLGLRFAADPPGCSAA
jgi:hypothetical protein